MISPLMGGRRVLLLVFLVHLLGRSSYCQKLHCRQGWTVYKTLNSSKTTCSCRRCSPNVQLHAGNFLFVFCCTSGCLFSRQSCRSDTIETGNGANAFSFFISKLPRKKSNSSTEPEIKVSKTELGRTQARKSS